MDTSDPAPTATTKPPSAPVRSNASDHLTMALVTPAMMAMLAMISSPTWPVAFAAVGMMFAVVLGCKLFKL